MNFNPITFWRDPSHAIEFQEHKEFFHNAQPSYYVKDLKEINVVFDMCKFAELDWSILELGCGAGRNLNQLADMGFTYLEGVEINPKSIKLLRETFPNLINVPIQCSSIQDAIYDIETVDVILCIGILMHLPYDLDWIFEAISNKARKLLYLLEWEGDGKQYFYKWQRNYQHIFEALGWRQVRTCKGNELHPLVPARSIHRIFMR